MSNKKSERALLQLGKIFLFTSKVLFVLEIPNFEYVILDGHGQAYPGMPKEVFET